MRHPHNHGRRFGRPGGWQQADVPDASDVAAWFAGRLPDEWFTGPPTIEVDREEIVVIGELPPLESGSETGETQAGGTDAAVAGRIARFRETTRAQRMQIADEAEARYGRKVAWGVTLDGHPALFTHLAVPVMTRLRQPERKVLDTLVDAGVARSRADALTWTVKLAGQHSEQWLAELREAMSKVDDLRSEGPQI